jgi:hypothetical protein
VTAEPESEGSQEIKIESLLYCLFIGSVNTAPDAGFSAVSIGLEGRGRNFEIERTEISNPNSEIADWTEYGVS